jgi:hypothetical protein
MSQDTPTIESSEGTPVDAGQFFRSIIADMPTVPKGKTETEVAIFISRYGENTGYSREQLSKIVKDERSNERKKRRAECPPADNEQSQEANTWAKWIMKIGFGVYLLAAIGIMFYAMVFLKLGWAWEHLRPHVTGIIAVGVVLCVLSYGWMAIRRAEISNRTKSFFAIIFLSLFLIVSAAGVLWIVTIVLKDAGIVRPVVSPVVVDEPKRLREEIKSRLKNVRRNIADSREAETATAKSNNLMYVYELPESQYADSLFQDYSKQTLTSLVYKMLEMSPAQDREAIEQSYKLLQSWSKAAREKYSVFMMYNMSPKELRAAADLAEEYYNSLLKLQPSWTPD